MASWRLLLPVLCIFLIPVTAIAQACLGVPLEPHGIALTGGVAFSDGGTGYGGDLHVNAYPIIVSGGYSLQTFDEAESNANNVRGSLSFELPDLPVSACPFAGVHYGRLTDQVVDGFTIYDVTLSTLTVPVGFAIGASLPVGPVLSFVPYAAPQFMYIRNTGTIANESGKASDEESFNEFGAQLGIMLSGPVVFGGPSVGISTFADSEPIFTLTLGLAAY